MDFLEGLIVPVIMAICLCLGFIIKNFDKIPNKWIPAILAVVGILIALWENWGAITPTTVAGGIVSALASIGAYESYRHLFGSDKNKATTESEG